MTLRTRLRRAMDNAMCGDTCFNMNCKQCDAARLQAICTTVSEYLTTVLKPLNPLVQAGFIPPETVRQLQAAMEDLRHDTHS